MEQKTRKRSETTVGLSATPTLYRLHWQTGAREDKWEHVQCGADLLLSGLNGDLDAEAKCPVCGSLTRILIVDQKIDGLEPEDAILHVVEMPTKSGRTWVECEATHIFDKKSCFQTWISTYKGRQGLVTSIGEYQDLIVRRRTDTRKIVPITPTGVKESGAMSRSDSIVCG